MNNWKVIFAAVVIFGAGVITGGLLVNYVKQSGSKQASASKPVSASEPHFTQTNTIHPADFSKIRPPEILSKQFLQKLNDEMRLSPEQREAVQKIIGESQNQIRKTIQDARLEIREVLSVEQQKQFDELIKRQYKKAVFGTNTIATGSAATNVPAAGKAP